MQTLGISSNMYKLSVAVRVGQQRLLSSPLTGIVGSSTVGVTVNTGNNNNDVGVVGSHLGGVRFMRRMRVNPKVMQKKEGGIQFHGFKYFPRFPDQKDPPYEPTKLFMVKRIRTLKKIPWWEKDLVKQLGLEDGAEIAIIKNSPTNNARLYQLKHLLEITPITTPYGMPDNPEHGFLKENGEFISYNSLQAPQLQLEEAKKAHESLTKKSVDGSTLRTRLRLKWYSRY